MFDIMCQLLRLKRREPAPPGLAYVKSRVIKDFELHTANGCDSIIEKRSKKQVMKASEFFEVMRTFHNSVDHPGRDAILHAAGEKYCFVPKELVMHYIRLCPTCPRHRHNLCRFLY